MTRKKRSLSVGPHVVRRDRVADEDVAARLAEIPVDSRDAVALFLGDPLPGRSALDQERARRTPTPQHAEVGHDVHDLKARSGGR